MQQKLPFALKPDFLQCLPWSQNKDTPAYVSSNSNSVGKYLLFRRGGVRSQKGRKRTRTGDIHVLQAQAHRFRPCLLSLRGLGHWARAFLLMSLSFLVSEVGRGSYKA